MTDDRNIPDQSLAAEFALGVLAGDDLRRAQELVRTDPAFRLEVARWAGRLAPMLDEIEPVIPPRDAWGRIEGSVGQSPGGSNVVQLRRRMQQWRGIAAAMTALAACLAIVLVATVERQVPPPVATQRPSGPPMVAMLGDQGQMKVVASWDPAAQQLVLAVAGDMPNDPRHSRELWVIPPGGKPRSLGTMADGKQMHVRLADALAQLLQQGATIAISVEPRGGSPTGVPTGPVVASGALSQA